jgi:hypothetical protein
MPSLNLAIDVLLCTAFGMGVALVAYCVMRLSNMLAPNRLVDGCPAHCVPRAEEFGANDGPNRDDSGRIVDPLDVYEHEGERAAFVVAAARKAQVRSMAGADLLHAPAAHAGDDFVTHEQSLAATETNREGSR